MRFLGGKSREEFEDMAKLDEYMSEAYETLKKISADDRAKLEYEARQKAIRDYNSQMNSARREGLEEGIEKGEILNKIKLGEEEISKRKISMRDSRGRWRKKFSAIEKIYQMVKGKSGEFGRGNTANEKRRTVSVIITSTLKRR